MKTDRYNLRLTESERELWENLAEEYNLPLAEFIRRAVFGVSLILSNQNHGKGLDLTQDDGLKV